MSRAFIGGHRVVLAVALVAALDAGAGPCNYVALQFVSFRADASTYASDTRVTCYNSYMSVYNGAFNARAWVVDETTGTTVGETRCSQCPLGETVWVGAVGGTTQTEHCYRGRVSASSVTYSEQEIASARVCVRASCEDLNMNYVCDNQEDLDKDPNEDSCPGGPPCTSPILVNLGRGEWSLAGVSDPVSFDIDADGVPDRITWTNRETAIALLALDRNANGIIDNGAELFGNWTILATGARAANGFEALKELDSDGDGAVTRLDARWTALRLWIDANHDGVSQPLELQALSAGAVEALQTSYHWTGRRDQEGNFFGYQGRAQIDGLPEAMYDVYFRPVP